MKFLQEIGGWVGRNLENRLLTFSVVVAVVAVAAIVLTWNAPEPEQPKPVLCPWCGGLTP